MQPLSSAQQYDGLHEVLESSLLGQLKNNQNEILEQLKARVSALSHDWQKPLIQMIDSILARSISRFLINLNRSLKLPAVEPIQIEVRHLLETLSRAYLTELRAHDIHSFVLEVFLTEEIEVDEVKEREVLGDSIYPDAPLLARAWCYLNAVSKDLSKRASVNSPNLVFFLEADGSSIRMIRMPSPHDRDDHKKLSCHYTAMLEDYRKSQWRHIDFCLVKLKEGHEDKTIALTRYAAQKEERFKETLLVWCCDVYSRFMTQRKAYNQKGRAASSFIKELHAQFFQIGMGSSMMPKRWRWDDAFCKKARSLFYELHKDVFFLKERLNLEERKDFCLLALIVVMEEMIEKYRPRSVMATCRSHIDRGMMVTTLLYVYALIKSGEYSEDRLQALWLMIFPPSLLFKQRPTHQGRMQRILSLLSRLSQAEVIHNLYQRKTYFSNFSCQSA